MALIKQIEDPEKRIKALYSSNDGGGSLIKKHLTGLFSYASHRVPEIADQLTSIDDAMKAGFAWSYGPFEYWDLIGIRQGIADAEAEGYTVAFWVHEMLDKGFESFYKIENGKRLAYNPVTKNYELYRETKLKSTSILYATRLRFIKMMKLLCMILAMAFYVSNSGAKPM
jgi:3-hydroxyacyl-CoA dehydrogenase